MNFIQHSLQWVLIFCSDQINGQIWLNNERSKEVNNQNSIPSTKKGGGSMELITTLWEFVTSPAIAIILIAKAAHWFLKRN